MFKGSPEMAARLKAMPWKERLLVLNNWLAFFFTFIYVGFFLKLWKQALMIFGLAMLAGVLCIWMVLVLLFKSFLHPVTILSALPLASLATVKAWRIATFLAVLDNFLV